MLLVHLAIKNKQSEKEGRRFLFHLCVYHLTAALGFTAPRNGWIWFLRNIGQHAAAADSLRSYALMLLQCYKCASPRPAGAVDEAFFYLQ